MEERTAAYDFGREEVHEPTERIWRKETRVTSALTLSRLALWEEEGSATHEFKAFMEKHGIKAGGELEKSRRYAAYLYKRFWVAYTRGKGIDNSILDAAKTVFRISSINWCGVDWAIPLEQINSNDVVRRLNAIRDVLDSMVHKVSNTTEKEFSHKITEYALTLHFMGDELVMESAEGKIVGNWKMLIAFQDSIVGMQDALMCAIIVDWEERTAVTGRVVDFIRRGISTHLLLGYDAYDVLKALYPSVVGGILKYESVFKNGLYKASLKDLRECPMKEFMKELPKNYADAVERLALAGLAKCFTYPIVLIGEAVFNVISKSKIFDPSEEGGLQARREFRRLWFHTYLIKKKEWPPVRVVGPIPGDVQTSIDTNSWQESKRRPWENEVFDNIEPLQALDFNIQVDETALLSDKAICSGLKSWLREFDTRMHPARYQKGCKPGPPLDNRLLIRHIKEPEVSAIDEALKFARCDNQDYHMAVMCLKERELNQSKGRYFTKQSFQGRHYQTLAEENVKNVLPYIPLTSMNLSGDAIVKYMLQKSADPNSIKVSVDFSKWCQYQRQGLAGPIARDIDAIYGVEPFFELAHIIPLGLWWFFQDDARVPEQGPDGLPIPGERAFYGLHTMGEGMYQRLWTLITSCGIKNNLRALGLDCDIMGSGDNQLITCNVPKGGTLGGCQARIMLALNTFSHASGLPIKIEETFSSLCYLEYGKVSYINGKRVSQALKKASRVGSESQETIPSINTKLSGIYASAIAVSAECSTPTAGFILALIETGLAMRTRGFTGDKSQLAAALMLTRQLGGLKTSPYASFCIRGINDTATIGVSVMQTLIERKEEFPGLYNALHTVPVEFGKLNWSQLFKDPYSLPYSRPRDADSAMRDLVSEILPAVAQNKRIKSLVSASAIEQESALVDSLKTMTPMSLKLCASIYELSNVATMEKILGKFCMATSVLKLAEDHTDFAVETKKAKDADLASLKRLSKKGRNDLMLWLNHECPTFVMDRVREYITGRDLSGPSAPAPQHQIIVKRWSEISTGEVTRCLKMTVDKGVRNYNIARGDGSCYIGSDTKVKYHKSPLALLNPEPLDKCALAVGELISWVGGEGNLKDLLTVMIEEKTWTPMDVVVSAADSVSGGIHDHRGRVQTLAQGAHLNYDPTIMSYFNITSDTALDFAKKGGDYTIMFQTIKIYAASYLIHRLKGGDSIEGEWAVHLKCEECTKRAYEGMYNLASPPSYRGFSLGTEGHLVFKRKGRPYEDDTQKRKHSLKSGHAYLAEKLVSSAAAYQNMSLFMEIDRVTTSEDFAVNTQASLTELSRANLKTLLYHIIQRIAIRPQFESLIGHLCNAYPDETPVLNPLRLIIDPILAAGRASEFRTLLGSVMSVNMDRIEGRLAVFGFLYRRHREAAIEAWDVFLSEDSLSARLIAMKMKAELIGADANVMKSLSSSLREEDAAILELRLGFRMATNPQVAQRSIREKVMNVNMRPECKLKKDIKGENASEFGSDINFSTTYGTSSFASQIYSIICMLKSERVWVIEDHGGKIGVVAGHITKECYIHDPRRKTGQSLRINNGPPTLYYDECALSYDRAYYIRALGSSVPPRPTEDDLLIVSVKDPLTLGIDIKDGDTLLSRENIGAPVVGFPKRARDDVWYCSKLYHPNHWRCAKDDKVRHYQKGNLAPLVRAKKFLGLKTLTLKNMLETVNRLIHISLMEFRGQVADFYDNVLVIEAARMQKQQKYRTEEEILTLLWLREKLLEVKGKYLEWHRHGLNYHVKTRCACTDVDYQKFAPYDELMAYAILGSAEIGKALQDDEVDLSKIKLKRLYKEQ